MEPDARTGPSDGLGVTARGLPRSRRCRECSLEEAGLPFAVRIVEGSAEVDRFPRVSGSILPRFFLGDPGPRLGLLPAKVDNGGLNWLRESSSVRRLRPIRLD